MPFLCENVSFMRMLVNLASKVQLKLAKIKD